MDQPLISSACTDAVYDYVSNLQGAADKIRKYGRAAGIIPQESSAQAITSTHGMNSIKLRRGILRQYLEMLDLRSHDDVERFVEFCSYLLRDLLEDSADFRSISVPLEQCGWTWEDKKLVKRAGVSPEILRGRTPRERVQIHIDRIDRDLPIDPPGAISSAKDMIESVCRGILWDRGVPFARDDNIGRLLKETYKLLVLDEISGDYKKALDQLLGGLNGTIGGVFALRNAEGRGHGHLEKAQVDRVVARLAVNTALTVCTFLTEYVSSQDVIASSSPGAQDSPGKCQACDGAIMSDHDFCQGCGHPIYYLQKNSAD